MGRRIREKTSINNIRNMRDDVTRNCRGIKRIIRDIINDLMPTT